MAGKPKKTADVAEVERLAAQGLAEYQIARALGMCPDTWTRVKREQAGVAEAHARGRRAAVGEIENVAFECAKKAKRDPKYQTSMIFWLKANAGWKDRTVIETVQSDGSGESREDLIGRVVALATGGGVGGGGGRPAAEA